MPPFYTPLLYKVANPLGLAIRVVFRNGRIWDNSRISERDPRTSRLAFRRYHHSATCLLHTCIVKLDVVLKPFISILVVWNNFISVFLLVNFDK